MYIWDSFCHIFYLIRLIRGSPRTRAYGTYKCFSLVWWVKLYFALTDNSLKTCLWICVWERSYESWYSFKIHIFWSQVFKVFWWIITLKLLWLYLYHIKQIIILKPLRDWGMVSQLLDNEIHNFEEKVINIKKYIS